MSGSGDAIGFGVGALVASEFIVALQAGRIVFDGLALVPALAGGLVLGVFVEVATRYLTGGGPCSDRRAPPDPIVVLESRRRQPAGRQAGGLLVIARLGLQRPPKSRWPSKT